MVTNTLAAGRSQRTRSKLPAIIACIVALVISMALPLYAFAAEETRTYTWGNGQQQPNIPQTITGADGREYRLTSQTQPVQASGSRTVSQSFSQVVNSQIWPDQLPNIGNIVPRTYHVSSDGYNGDIPRTAINYTPVYRTEATNVSTTSTAMGNTEEAARANLPETVSYAGRTLSLIDSTVEPYKTSSSGDVLMWLATGTYSVSVPKQVLDHYNVAANYSGTLTKTIGTGDWSLQATYTNDDQDAAQTDAANNKEEETITEMPSQTMDENGNLSPYRVESTYDDAADGDGSDDDADSAEGSEDGSSFPLIPVLAVAAVIMAILAALAIILSKRKKGKGSKTKGSSDDAAGGAMGSEESAMVTAAAIAAMPSSHDCQLIEVSVIEDFDDDGNLIEVLEQTPKANLEVEPSITEEAPTIVYLPPLVDAEGNIIEFVATPGAQYWVALDDATVDAAVSKDLLVVSDDSREVFRGSFVEMADDSDAGEGYGDDYGLTNHVMLDEETLVAALNPDAPDRPDDIRIELRKYQLKDEYARMQAEKLEAADQDGYGDGISYGDGSLDPDGIYDALSFDDDGDGLGRIAFMDGGAEALDDQVFAADDASLIDAEAFDFALDAGDDGMGFPTFDDPEPAGIGGIQLDDEDDDGFDIGFAVEEVDVAYEAGSDDAYAADPFSDEVSADPFSDDADGFDMGVFEDADAAVGPSSDVDDDDFKRMLDSID